MTSTPRLVYGEPMTNAKPFTVSLCIRPVAQRVTSGGHICIIVTACADYSGVVRRRTL
jgi:hypothetical protein